MSRSLAQPRPSVERGSARRSDAWRAAVVCGLLVLAVLLVFGRTLGQKFFSIDDNLFVYNEPNVSGGLSWSSVVWAFTNGPLGEWYPLTMLSHMLDCQLYGLEPAGHHLTNVLLHASSSVALFLVLWRMTGGLWPSALVAALFALHPLHVEPVAWIASRRDTLSGLFFMLTLGAYDAYVRHPRSLGRYLAVVGFFALGLMSKAILVTLPPLLLLLDYWPLARFGRAEPAGAVLPPQRAFTWRVVLDKVPLFALALADAAMTMHTHGMVPDSLSMAERCANAAISYVVYLGQLFVPVGLSVFNAHPEAGRPAWQVAGALATLLAITAAAVIWRRSRPYFFVGWFWYVGMLVPVSGLLFVGPQSRADRYTYLSQIGLYIALVWGAMQLVPAWPWRRWALAAGSALMLAALIACSWRQLDYWKNDQTLWEHALACYPRSATAHYFLGAALEEKDERGAIEQYRQALEIGPDERNIYDFPRAMAHSALANLAERKGDPAAAAAHYEQAIQAAPGLATPYMSLGNLLARQGNLDAAIERFRQCIGVPGGNAPAVYCNLGIALSQQGRTDEAIASFRQALEGDDNLALAHLHLARLLAGRDLVDEAIGHFLRTIDINPDMALPYHQIAQLLRGQGKTSEADRYDEQGIQARQRFAEAQNVRGTELAQQGKTAEAINQFMTVIAAVPEYAPAHCNLADALALQGHLDGAISEYREALRIDPNLTPARQGLERLSNR